MNITAKAVLFSLFLWSCLTLRPMSISMAK